MLRIVRVVEGGLRNVLRLGWLLLLLCGHGLRTARSTAGTARRLILLHVILMVRSLVLRMVRLPLYLRLRCIRLLLLLLGLTATTTATLMLRGRLLCLHVVHYRSHLLVHLLLLLLRPLLLRLSGLIGRIWRLLLWRLLLLGLWWKRLCIRNGRERRLLKIVTRVLVRGGYITHGLFSLSLSVC